VRALEARAHKHKQTNTQTKAKATTNQNPTPSSLHVFCSLLLSNSSNNSNSNNNNNKQQALIITKMNKMLKLIALLCAVLAVAATATHAHDIRYATVQAAPVRTAYVQQAAVVAAPTVRYATVAAVAAPVARTRTLTVRDVEASSYTSDFETLTIQTRAPEPVYAPAPQQYVAVSQCVDCIPGDDCCSCKLLGTVCFSPATHRCIPDDMNDGTELLCGNDSDGACGDACFRKDENSCIGGALVSHFA
jgi:hypothetical protein